MATRKIKDAKDLSTNELIYFKGHAKATYMSDGKTVEDAINQIGTGGGGGIGAETDPIFSASPAASITKEKKAEWDNKQAKLVSGTNIKTINGDSILGEGDLKIDGSIETYTTPFSTSHLRDVKEGLESSIEANFDEITQAIKDNKLIILPTNVGVTVTSAKYNSKRKCAYLTVIDYQGVLTYVKWNDGDTELSAENIELFDIGDIDYRLGLLEEDIPTKVSQLENDAEYITQDDLAAVATSGSYNDLTDSPFIPNADSVKTWGFVKGVKLNGSTKTPSVSDGIVDLGTIGGGGGSSSGRNLVSSVDLIFSEDDPLLPDTIYYCNDVVAIDISAVTPPSGDYAEYSLLFTTDEDTYIVCPDTWLWANGQAPSVEGNTVYELSVVATKFGSDYIYKAVLTPFKSV